MGTMPLETPLVPLIYESLDLILEMDRPMPPADFDILAHWLKVS